MGTTNVARVLTVLVLISSACSPVWSQYPGQNMQQNFYQGSCPDAISTIARVVSNAMQNNVRVGPGLLRIFFHDCFVEGCDASVLIDAANNGGDAEKLAVPNQTLQTSPAFDVIDDAKAAVENICPETVSCADVVAYAAVTAIAVLGGPAVEIQGGRLDGYNSSSGAAIKNLPSPLNSLSQLQDLFSSKGLNPNDLVVLSGAHTIGQSHCSSFGTRLYPTVDQTLNGDFASSLEQQCPTSNSANLVNNDVQTANSFDNGYHQDVVDGKVLLKSDESLYTSTQTAGYVNKYAASNFDFLGDFGNALIKMGQIGVKTGSNGNIRKTCRAFNS